MSDTRVNPHLVTVIPLLIDIWLSEYENHLKVTTCGIRRESKDLVSTTRLDAKDPFALHKFSS